MEETIPKLKFMGLLVFTGTFLQLLGLTSSWFAIGDTYFSIKGVSHAYPIDMITSSCSTIQTAQGFLCFCNSHCPGLNKLNFYGWACGIIIIMSTNCFVTEIFSIRRKIWKCEGIVLQNSLIDYDIFMIIGTFLLNIGVLLWLWETFQLEISVELAGGINLIFLACVVHVISTMYYFIRIRGETRSRQIEEAH
ncbi:hypothetical protein SteCoe_21174 [Stentor coeruleus]|uniref:Uncharacterized protein n=1 Tax=Stentor coeruleus TaxID=5963 RepID=A0A1R2BQ92_9CILI|nr:hypothetical protein SteCoe_21174 [Stentor coeruleus]